MMTTKLTYTISNMVNDDIPYIVELDSRSFGKHHWDKESFYSEIHNNLAHYYVARGQDGTILGYIGFWVVFEEAHITNISVNPDFRRQKVALALLNEMIQCCYENMVKFITLEVRVSNIAAINLYEKLGMKSVGVRKAYYQDNNEDALIMFTNNIFYSQFRNVYDEAVKELSEVSIEYDKAFKR